MTNQLTTCPKPLLSYHCWGYDFMWIDKQRKWHVAYQNVPAHKECKANGSKALPKNWVWPPPYVPCQCPCHHNWNPEFATSGSDHRKPEIEEVLDA